MLRLSRAFLTSAQRNNVRLPQCYCSLLTPKYSTSPKTQTQPPSTANSSSSTSQSTPFSKTSVPNPSSNEQTDLIPKEVPWYLRWMYKQSLKVEHTNQLYVSCVQQTARVLNESGIEKNFNTWYALVVLHLWMVFVRLRQDGPAGQELSQVLFDSFWSDSETRMIELRISNPVTLSRATKFYARVYYGSVVAYDESLSPTDSDMILADAIWRNLFGTVDTSAVVLDKFVQYVRRELTNLDNTEGIVMRGVINWGPPPK